MSNIYSLSDTSCVERPTKNRITYIDASKGVLIILIVLGHVFFKAKYMNFVYTFHLSSFYIISGILFCYTNKVAQPFFVVFKKAIFSLVVPFLFFETVGGIIKKVMHQDITILQLVISPFKDSYSYHIPADWYLLTAFFSEIILVCVEKAFHNKYLKIAIYITICIIGFALPRNGRYFPLVGRTLIATAIMASGYYTLEVFTSIDKALIVISVALVFCCTMINGYVSLYSINIKNPFFYLVGTISGAYLCVSLCHLRFNKVLSIIGRNSLIIMGTHQLFISYLHLNRYLLLLVIVLCEMPIIYVIRKYLPFCVGIKNNSEIKLRQIKE